MRTVSLPGFLLPDDAPTTAIDIDALRRKAAPDDQTPVIVTRRYLAQIDRELTAGRMLAQQLKQAAGLDAVLRSIRDVGATTESAQ